MKQEEARALTAVAAWSLSPAIIPSDRLIPQPPIPSSTTLRNAPFSGDPASDAGDEADDYCSPNHQLHRVLRQFAEDKHAKPPYDILQEVVIRPGLDAGFQIALHLGKCQFLAEPMVDATFDGDVLFSAVQDCAFRPAEVRFVN